jgi:hypothetical protein
MEAQVLVDDLAQAPDPDPDDRDWAALGVALDGGDDRLGNGGLVHQSCTRSSSWSSSTSASTVS